jgi:hypothetical protein
MAASTDDWHELATQLGLVALSARRIEGRLSHHDVVLKRSERGAQVVVEVGVSGLSIKPRFSRRTPDDDDTLDFEVTVAGGSPVMRTRALRDQLDALAADGIDLWLADGTLTSPTLPFPSDRFVALTHRLVAFAQTLESLAQEKPVDHVFQPEPVSVRLDLVRALSPHDPRDREAIERLRDDVAPEVRAAAAFVSLDPDAVMEVLLDPEQPPDSRHRAMRTLGDDVSDHAITRLTQGDQAIDWVLAARLASRHPSEAATTALLRTYTEHDVWSASQPGVNTDINGPAARAFAEAPVPAVTRWFLEMLPHDPRAELVRPATRHLAEHGTVEHVPALRAIVASGRLPSAAERRLDAVVRHIQARAGGSTGQLSFADDLGEAGALSVVDDQDERLREAAARSRVPER